MSRRQQIPVSPPWHSRGFLHHYPIFPGVPGTRRGHLEDVVFHAGKGQQFDWVFVLGLEDGTIPDYRAQSSGSKREEARVLSVMISRARIGVFGTYIKVDTQRNYRKRPSEFIGYLNKVPGFLCGKDDIEMWCSKADWPTIALM